MRYQSETHRVFAHALIIFVLVISSGCVTTAHLQGAAGPVASPRATATLDLPDELAARARRLVPEGVDVQMDAKYRDYRKFCVSDGRFLKETEFDDQSFVARGVLSNPNRPTGVTKRERQCLADAGELFERAIWLPRLSADERMNTRNSMQEELVRASTMSCSLYKRYINAYQSDTNLYLGAMTTIFAAASAIVGAPAAAQNWAGSAAIASGLRAEFNADAFASQTAYVIAKAIDADRESTLRTLRQKQDLPYNKYTVQAAVSDALDFHDRCSLYRGIQVLDNAVMVLQDPGLRHISGFIQSGKVEVGTDGRISMTDVRPRLAALAGVPQKTDDLDLPTSLYETTRGDFNGRSGSLEVRRTGLVKSIDEQIDIVVATCPAKDKTKCDAVATDRITTLSKAKTDITKTESTQTDARVKYITGVTGLDFGGCFDPYPALPSTCNTLDVATKKRNDLEQEIRTARGNLRKAEDDPTDKKDEAKLASLRAIVEAKETKARVFSLEQIQPVRISFDKWHKETSEKLEAAKKVIDSK